MMIYKNDGKKGFAVSTNLINRENLSAGGLAAAVLTVMLLITKSKKKKSSSMKETKPKKSEKKSKKSKSKSKGLIKILIIPAVLKAAKYAVTQGKLHSLVNKVKSGENLVTNAISDAPAKDEQQKDNKPVTVCGMEIIEPIDIDSEERVYEYI